MTAPQFTSLYWDDYHYKIIRLFNSGLTKKSLNVISCYLGKVTQKDVMNRTIVIDRSELQNTLRGILHWQSVLDSLENMPMVECGDGKFAVFEYFKNEYIDGLETLTLKMTETAFRYFCLDDDFEKIKYVFNYSLMFESKYTRVLFLYLIDKQDEKVWDISLEELRYLLDASSPTYSAFYRFNAMILSKSYDEITMKTDFRYVYVALREGRECTGVRFSVISGFENIDDTERK